MSNTVVHQSRFFDETFANSQFDLFQLLASQMKLYPCFFFRMDRMASEKKILELEHCGIRQYGQCSIGNVASSFTPVCVSRVQVLTTLIKAAWPEKRHSCKWILQ